MTHSRGLLLQDVRLLDPSQNLDLTGDLLIENGKISAIAPAGQISSDRAPKVIPLHGAWILPGFIDTHVHLREPGQEHKETIASGTHAAVAGGFTAVACMANTSPVNDCPEVLEKILASSRSSARCRVFPIAAITRGLKGETLTDIRELVRLGACAISDDGRALMNSALMREAMALAQTSGIPVISHAEDENLCRNSVMNEGIRSRQLNLRGTPAEAEEIIVARDIALCRLTRAHLHIAHLSTRAALAHLQRAKEEGLPVTAEVTPHHLVLTEAAVDGQDTNFKMSPPLRTAEDQQALIQGLKSGLIDMIATDHAPHSLKEKASSFSAAANGIIGLQTAAALTYGLVCSGVLPLERWIEAMTTAPAKLLRLPFGSLRIGAPADLTVFDPTSSWILQKTDILSKSLNSPFIARPLQGRIILTIIEGAIAHALKKDYE